MDRGADLIEESMSHAMRRNFRGHSRVRLWHRVRRKTEVQEVEPLILIPSTPLDLWSERISTES